MQRRARALRLWLRKAGASLQTISVSTSRIEVCMSITHCSGGRDSSPFPWRMVMVIDPKPNGTVVKVSGLQNSVCFWRWNHNRRVSSPAFLSLGLHTVSQSPAWIPKYRGRYFDPRVDAKLLLLKEDYMQRTSYSAILLMLFWGVLFFPLAQFEDSRAKPLLAHGSHMSTIRTTAVCSNWWH